MKKRMTAILAGIMAAALLAGCGSSGSSSTSTSTASNAASSTASEAVSTAASEASTTAVSEAAPASTEASTTAASEAETTTATDVEPVTLNVAYMPNYGSLWSVETAIHEGYLEDEGITVNLVEFADGPTIISAMESGSIDIGYIGQGAHKLCINGRAKIFALSHISNGDALIAKAGINSVEELKGLQVGYSSGTSSEDILTNALTKAGMTMDDIQAVDMDASAIVTAMLSGGVDAVATWSPNSLKIMDEMPDAVKLADNLTFSDTTISLASWICMPSYAEEHRDILLRFTRALFKAMDYAADDHYDEVAQWVSEQTATDYDSVYDQRGDAEWLTGKTVSEGAADGTVEGYYELQKQNFVDAGAVEVDPVPAVSDYVMLDLMQEAGQY